jgi:hypothetical protein
MKKPVKEAKRKKHTPFYRRTRIKSHARKEENRGNYFKDWIRKTPALNSVSCEVILQK